MGSPINCGSSDDMNALPPNGGIIAPQYVPEPPPSPAELVVHEYKWTNTSSDSKAPYSIATKDGRVLQATAVWMQGNVVSMITTEGEAKKVPLDQVARDVTRRLNAENKLTLSFHATATH
jgi:hypothetical protein